MVQLQNGMEYGRMKTATNVIKCNITLPVLLQYKLYCSYITQHHHIYLDIIICDIIFLYYKAIRLVQNKKILWGCHRQWHGSHCHVVFTAQPVHRDSHSMFYKLKQVCKVCTKSAQLQQNTVFRSSLWQPL